VAVGEVLNRKPQYGLTAKASKETLNIRYLRISDITDQGNLKNNDPRFLDLNEQEFNKYRLYKGDILIARSGSVGRVCLHHDYKQKVVFAFYLIRFRLDTNQIIPKFFFYYGLSPLYKKYIEDTLRIVAQPNINATEYSNLQIPLPSLPEQKRIVARIEALFSKIDEIKRLRKEANDLAKTLMQSALHEVFSKADEKGWKWVRLGEVCEINPSKKEITSISNDLEVSFIPMDAVDEGKGEIVNSEIRKIKEVRKGYTYFKEEDVIFAKITPCMENGKCAIAKNLVNKLGFGSTEFHVIRPLNSVLSEWIWFYLRQQHIREEATKYFTGSVGQQRVPKEFLENLLLPLPSLPEQKRVVARIEALFSKIDEIKRLRKEANDLAKTLLQSALHEVFSKADEKGWRWVRLGEVVETTSGGTPQRSIKEYWENGTIPWVKSGELENNIISKTEEKITLLGLENSNAKLFQKGTLIVAMYGATVGKTAILGIDAATNQAVCGIFPKIDLINRDYIRYFFIYKRPELVKNSFGGAQPNISQTVIRDLLIPLPPLPEQKRIIAYLDTIQQKAQALQRLQAETEREIEKLKESILHKAFRGEL